MSGGGLLGIPSDPNAADSAPTSPELATYDEEPHQDRNMSSTPVQQDQFEISPKGITHKPTGTTYTPHPGAPYSGSMSLTEFGSALPNREDYRPEEVQTMMERLWAEYVATNPRLFEVHD
jgi:hypothetical protein